MKANAFDNFDDDVAQLISRLEKLASREPSTASSLSKVTKRLKHLQRRPSSVTDSISSFTSEEGSVCLLQQHEEYIIDMKRELAAIRNELLSENSMKHWERVCSTIHYGTPFR